METRPDMEKYHGLISTVIITILATIMMCAGVFYIVAGIKTNTPMGEMSGVLLGVICIVVSSILFIIASIAEDIHYKRYLQQYYGEETVNYHELSLQKLQSIEWMLHQTYHRQQTPYVPVTSEPERYAAPQTAFQSDQQAPQVQPKKQAYSGTAMDRGQADPDNEPATYNAQYRRPTPNRKQPSARDLVDTDTKGKG